MAYIYLILIFIIIFWVSKRNYKKADIAIKENNLKDCLKYALKINMFFGTVIYTKNLFILYFRIILLSGKYKQIEKFYNNCKTRNYLSDYFIKHFFLLYATYLGNNLIAESIQTEFDEESKNLVNYCNCILSEDFEQAQAIYKENGNFNIENEELSFYISLLQLKVFTGLGNTNEYEKLKNNIKSFRPYIFEEVKNA